MMKKEIMWNIVNSLLGGGLVFIGALSDGHINWDTIVIAFVVAMGVAFTQFKEYWQSEKSEYTTSVIMGRFV